VDILDIVFASFIPLNKTGSSLYENTHVKNDAPNLNKIMNTKITRSKNENLAIKLLDSKNSFCAILNNY